MLSAADEAMRMFSKWVQESTQLRLSVSMTSVSLSVLSEGTMTRAELNPTGSFVFAVGNVEIAFLADDAKFEYKEPREPDLQAIGFDPRRFASCWVVTFRNPLFGDANREADAFLMVCEMRR